MVENVKRRSQTLFGAQIRAARALLRWSAAELAEESAVGANTIRRAESEDGVTSMTAANQRAIRQALEDAGVQFIDENGEGPGVRLSKPIPRER
jgi:transcriptional regulator with XRE-family HTH domain